MTDTTLTPGQRVLVEAHAQWTSTGWNLWLEPASTPAGSSVIVRAGTVRWRPMPDETDAHEGVYSDTVHDLAVAEDVLDAVIAERDAARKDRDAERNRAEAAEQALADGERLTAELAEARRELALALSEKTEARAEAKRLLTERDWHIAKGRELKGERDELRKQLNYEQMTRERRIGTATVESRKAAERACIERDAARREREEANATIHRLLNPTTSGLTVTGTYRVEGALPEWERELLEAQAPAQTPGGGHVDA